MAPDTIDPGVRTLADLPGPKGIPLLGNALQLDPVRIHTILEDWVKQYGPALTIRLGPKQVFVTSDMSLMHTVLHERPHRYRRFSPIESVLSEMGGNGVFSAEGDAWLPQRKLIMHALASNHFRTFFPSMHAITQRLLNQWQRAARNGDTIDMCRDLTRYTVDTTTTLAFGVDPNTLEQSGGAIQDHMAYIFPTILSRVNAPFPWWRYVKLPRDRQFDHALSEVQHYVAGLITGARARRAAHPGEPPHNLLEAMLAAGEETGSPMSDDAIFANTFTVLMAGEDTTAFSLAWAMYCLCKNPHIQERMHDAARQVFGDAPLCPTFDDVRKLDYFDGVAHEAMRLKPIAPLLFFEPLVDVVLGGVALPAGTPIFFVLRPAMQDPHRFGQPDAFLPERWAAGHEHVQPHDAHGFLQFGGGPRVCPGRHLASVEQRLVLSMLARHFTMEFAGNPDDIKEESAFTMRPSSMPVRLKLRD
ncbi:cytochrome P450 [Pseudoduganella ginsengisoli]|uniref:Cytochrome P450 n=1 Tax=Pseudoduganella ginsengisoli TaxID=1462440 RepID=A0A6L6Q823_9BURK|nr:cytochrome P450 [Pseudoduganella ginsengisoli]MTW05599.1 cytochrome P450 [Pseudoduganella ginsengisoli]